MPKLKMDRRKWIEAKNSYIYSDMTKTAIAKKYGISRQALINGFNREFPGVDLLSRKREEKAKREAMKAERREERRIEKESAFRDKVVAMDEKHLRIINLALDRALEELENGTLKAKSINDIKELINMERRINEQLTSDDKIIIVGLPDSGNNNGIPDVIDCEYEEL